jgi:hypothetical protein
MNVTEMLDQQLNEAIAVLLGEYVEPPKYSDVELYGNKKGYSSFCDGVLVDCHPDYVDDWDKLMPLGIKYKITLSPDSEYNEPSNLWSAATNDADQIEVWNEDPQRALAECLLLALQK